MPKEVIPNIESWRRGGGRIPSKQRVVMTEEQKQNVARCQGTKSEHLCKNPIFRCDACGNYGCVQDFVNKCSEQAFRNDICLHCGLKDTAVPVMMDEYEQVVADWDEK